jgi:hypothetical protein
MRKRPTMLNAMVRSTGSAGVSGRRKAAQIGKADLGPSISSAHQNPARSTGPS